MAKPVPRASILVTFFNDPDTLGLMSNGNDGPRAVLMFIGLLVLAKDLHNKGEFKGKIEIYSGQLMLEPKRSRRLFNMLSSPSLRWVEEVHPGFKIRSWEKHNQINEAWGGKRDGAGRRSIQSEASKEDKKNAQNAVWRAVSRGEIVRPDTCSKCAGGGDIEAHHHDYFKPLDVIWLCKKCHGMEHSNNHLENTNNQDECSSSLENNHLGYMSDSYSSSDSELQQQHAGEAVLSMRTKPGKAVKPDESDPDAALIAHVCNCIAATMRLDALRPHRNEPQTVEPNVRAWLARPAPTIHGATVTMAEVVERAADHAAESELGGTVKGALSWCESVIDRACRDQVWPGEFKAAKKTGVTIERPPEVPEYKTPEERQRERRERERNGHP